MALQDIAPDGVMGAAIDTVITRIDKMEQLGDRYKAEISAALQNIQNITVAAVPAPMSLSLPNAPIPNLNFDQIPSFQPEQLQIPDAPTLHSIDDLLNDLDLGELDLPNAPEFPSIEMPQKPSLTAYVAPERPEIDTEVQIPDAPNLVLPELEQLIELQLPDFQFDGLPDFDGQAPSIGNISVPNVFVDWHEPQYQSELLDPIQAKVKSWLDGGTGLPAVVEDALFNRGRTRQSKETERAVKEAVNEWSSRNFTLPPGALNAQVAAIRENGRLQAAELNRDVLIEAAKWEIENIRFAVGQGIALEQLTVNLFSNMTNRLFEVARFNAESQINVFNAQIALFNAQNDAFRLTTEVYRTKLEGAIAKLTAFKTQIDAQVALGQINEQRVQVYRARMEAVMSNVEIYKAMVQGASVRAEVIKNRFDAYRTEIQGFAEMINSEKLKVEMYEAETRAEASKANMYDAAARTYASTIQGLNAKADIQSKKIALKMDAARVWLGKYTADQETFKATLQANLSQVQVQTAAFGANVDAWKAKGDISISNAEMQSRYVDMNTRTNIAYSEMQIKEYEANINKVIKEAEIALESAKAIGQYTAQLAAGALSAAHVSASISGSGSASTSSSTSNSTSTSHNYTY